MRGGPCEIRERREHPLAVEADEPVPAQLDGLGPLRGLAQREARHLEQVGLLLHAAGVGQHRTRVAQQLRGSRGIRAAAGAAGRPAARACRAGPAASSRAARARVHREQRGERAAPRSTSTSRSSSSGSSTLPARCAVTSRYSPGVHAEPRERIRLARRDRRRHQRHVRHHVTDQLDSVGDALAREVLDRGRRGAQQQVAEMVGEHAVALLRHRVVERAHARLHVRERQLEPRARERAREGRVRVAVDEHEVRLHFAEHRLERVHHARDLLRGGAGADAQLAVGRRQCRARGRTPPTARRRSAGPSARAPPRGARAGAPRRPLPSRIAGGFPLASVRAFAVGWPKGNGG